jgi:antirestriction protein ArdC
MKPHSKPAADVPKWASLLVEAVNKPGLIMEAYSAFHRYSIANQILALVQCQLRGLEPGPINTFPGWQELGRSVKRGERALTLCMPITRKIRNEESQDNDSENEERTFTAFMYKPRWFVLSQTAGDEFIPPCLPPEWNAEQALAALNIERISFTHTDGNCQGYAKLRQIAINPVAQLPHKTLFHEAAHVMLGHTSESDFADTEQTPKNLREVEAEAVALLCCEALNLEGAAYCRGYIQNWLYPMVGYNGGGMPEKSAQKIFHAADQILRAGRLSAHESANQKQANEMSQASAFALA